MGAAATTATLVENVRSRRWRAFDLQLFLYMLLLIAFGVVMGYSASYNDPTAGPGLSQTVKTLIWTAIGMTLFFVAASVDYHWLQTLTVPIYLFVLGTLTLTMFVGTNLFGAQMSITVAGLDFQFSEISKILMIVVLASSLAGRREKIGRLSTIVGAGVLMAVPTFLVFPQADPQGACYQLIQAMHAVGSGGLFAQGLTAGRQNQLGFLPVQSTDFIFTVVAEELGLVGGLVLLALFALLIWRILAIGWGARDRLGAMVAAGIGSMLLFQIMVNIGMVIGIMPVTGIPLPFITYGGSSLISLLFGMGILQSIRMHSVKPTF